MIRHHHRIASRGSRFQDAALIICTETLPVKVAQMHFNSGDLALKSLQ